MEGYRADDSCILYFPCAQVVDKTDATHINVNIACYRRRRSSPVRTLLLRPAPPPPPSSALLLGDSGSPLGLLQTSTARNVVTMRDTAKINQTPVCASSSGSLFHRYSMSNSWLPSSSSLILPSEKCKRIIGVACVERLDGEAESASRLRVQTPTPYARAPES